MTCRCFNKYQFRFMCCSVDMYLCVRDCLCVCVCVAFLPAGTDSLSTNIMTLFPSAQDCRSLQVFLPLLLLMRNHRIYVYMKLAVFLFALCFICFHPQRGFVSQWHSCAARNDKKNNKKPF